MSGLNDRRFVRGQIIDASLSGCRLSCDELYTLPDDIHLRIPRFDQPIRGEVMWRGAGVAGIKMLWEFSGKDEVVFRI